jgi:hypothetical protein
MTGLRVARRRRATVLVRYGLDICAPRRHTLNGAPNGRASREHFLEWLPLPVLTPWGRTGNADTGW